ncbi:uncharacterized protein DNG_00546 [Cephalotrichum gorgonifer]|uniref:Uncharacterized protein n=1 Tax=Cephalotrichum gorgonifer TaxID=2041049 RepID=A0AAE8SQX1_9PEZI|nr:uncharacterized protein DNG_00546 [Cephalotrichum gorgonifer]
MTTASTTKPKLAQLSTPVTASFPSHISGHSPLSAMPRSADPTKTPISPPLAYTDFLRFMSLNSPVIFKGSLSGESTPGSGPSTGTTAPSEYSRTEFKSELRSPMTAPAIPPSPFTQLPMSAPATGAQCFPSLKIPPSPAISNYDSPISARSPYSARSNSKFDWEAALKARKFEMKKQSAKQASRTSVRHIREVITRTVTYTPRMAPAPKGKRRKIE